MGFLHYSVPSKHPWVVFITVSLVNTHGHSSLPALQRLGRSMLGAITSSVHLWRHVLIVSPFWHQCLFWICFGDQFNACTTKSIALHGEVNFFHTLFMAVSVMLKFSLSYRWIQWGAFSPIFRTHCTKNPLVDRRIWVYPPVRHVDALINIY